MIEAKRRVITFFLIIFLTACASLNPNFDEPELTVTAFRLLPSNGLPKFEIELNVINPNSFELELRGISYSASIEGNKVLSGVANKIPIIPSYGEGKVKLSGNVDLFGSFQLLTDLMQQRNSGINYKLNVNLDVGTFMPKIRVVKEGQVIPPAN